VKIYFDATNFFVGAAQQTFFLLKMSGSNLPRANEQPRTNTSPFETRLEALK